MANIIFPYKDKIMSSEFPNFSMPLAFKNWGKKFMDVKNFLENIHNSNEMSMVPGKRQFDYGFLFNFQLCSVAPSFISDYLCLIYNSNPYQMNSIWGLCIISN